VDEFQVKNEVYKQPMSIAPYLDPSLVQEIAKEK
jgi:hypothetical protein